MAKDPLLIRVIVNWDWKVHIAFFLVGVLFGVIFPAIVNVSISDDLTKFFFLWFGFCFFILSLSLRLLFTKVALFIYTDEYQSVVELFSWK